MNADDYAEMHGRIRATEKARDTYAAQTGAALDKLHAAQKRIAELEVERDDYRERWEQTGCTRHSAMESAIKLAESYRQQLDDMAAERDRLRKALDFYACIDHYPGGAEPYATRDDYGRIARAALENPDAN